MLNGRQGTECSVRGLTCKRQRPVAWPKADLGGLRGAPDLDPISSMGAMDAALSGM